MKGIIPCQLESNKQHVFDLPSEFQDICKLENILIAKRLLLRKLTAIWRGKMSKIAGTQRP